MDFYTWIHDNIDKNVSSAKHRTGAGMAMGDKYWITLPCNKRNGGKTPIIQFWDDRLVLIMNEAWVDEDTAKRILLAAIASPPISDADKEVK